MEYYGNNDWRDYHLAHHGVKGMKWGVRRYQPYSVVPRGSGEGGKEIGEAKRAKTGVIERAKIRVRYHNMRNLNRMIQTRRAKGIGNKLSTFAGNKRREDDYRNKSKEQEKLAAASKTKLGKRIHETKAANNFYKEQYYKHAQDMSLGEKVFNNVVYRREFAHMPYQRLSGRTTTRGRELLSTALTGGFGGLALDAKYLHDRKKAAKTTNYSGMNNDKKAQKAEVKRIKQEQKTEAKLQKKAEKQANKDAKEYVTAKMYHGEGAGVRRREINNVVKDRQKDPRYKSAFEKAVQQQDMQKAVNTARRQRKTKDAGNAVKKTSRGVVNLALGRGVPATAAAIGIYNAAKVTGVDKRVAEAGKDFLKRMTRGY